MNTSYILELTPSQAFFINNFNPLKANKKTGHNAQRPVFLPYREYVLYNAVLINLTAGSKIPDLDPEHKESRY
jgi:hypothetical protein